MLSPYWSTGIFAELLREATANEVRNGARTYRNFGSAADAGKITRQYGYLYYALAEALEYIAVLKDEKQ